MYFSVFAWLRHAVMSAIVEGVADGLDAVTGTDPAALPERLRERIAGQPALPAPVETEPQPEANGKKKGGAR